MAAEQQPSWIDLAPNHKLGLIAVNPLLLGAGAIGYGEAIPRGLDLGQVGAAVVGPLLGSSRGGSQPPRLAHVNGGIVLDTGLQNRGVNNAVQQYGKLWENLGCPVVVEVAESHPQTLARMLGKLANLPGVQGIELLPPSQIDAQRLSAFVRAAEKACELPLWVKLPLGNAAVLAPAACEAGAVGLVVGQAPPGTAGGVQGAICGPLIFPLMLAALLEVAALGLPAALIACGGIHTAEHVRQSLAGGASAVQIDSAVWVEPGLPGRLAAVLTASAE